MQRKWAVRPDQGEMLSREALIAALVDGATLLDLAGGCLEVVVGRIPTGVPGEMVMNGAIVCWRDRTDAKPQAEPTSQVVPVPLPAEPAEIDPEEPEEDDEEPEPDDDRDPDDGFDYGQMPSEDVENEPVAVR